MVHDFVDDDGANLRPGVERVQRARLLGRKMFRARARDVAAKGNAVLRRAEIEAVEVAGEFPGDVRREEVNFVTIGTERETRRHAGVGIEVGFVEHAVTARENHRPVRDAEFLRRVQIVGQVPAANVHVAAGRIGQLNAVGGRRGVAAGQNLVDQNGCEAGRRGVVRAGRTAGHTAGTPLGLGAPVVGRGVFIHDDE